MSEKYAAMFGYTQEELERYFSEEIDALTEKLEVEKSELLEGIRKWYDGYSWDGKTYVYKPFSVMRFFDEGKFRNYWFETGTPSFLINLVRQRDVDIENLENFTGYEVLFECFDLSNMDVYSLLFQTGYLYSLHIPFRIFYISRFRDWLLTNLSTQWAYDGLKPWTTYPTWILVIRY